MRSFSLMDAVQTLSDKVHLRTGLSSMGQSGWLFATAAGLTFLREAVDISVDPLGNPASLLASMLFLSIMLPALLGNLIRPGRQQAMKAGILLTVAIAAGGTIDLLIWAFHALMPAFGGVRSLSALAGVAVGMSAIARARLAFRQEQAWRAATACGQLPAANRSGPSAAWISASLLIISSSCLVLAGVSFSSVTLCLSFGFALAAGLLLMCRPQPPSSRRRQIYQSQTLWQRSSFLKGLA